MNETISIDDCASQVRTMGNLVGLLFYHFAATLIQELGEETGKMLTLKAIRSYGRSRGHAIRKSVLDHGLELSIENFSKFSDLPSLGWKHDDEGVTYCCFAEPWLEREEQELGKLYCEVDIAKMKAYNPAMRVEQVKSILNGETCCKYIIEFDPKKD